MSDVKVERKESVSRDEAARWLSLLSRAFTVGYHAELPFGPGTVSLHIPDRVRAELAVQRVPAVGGQGCPADRRHGSPPVLVHQK